MEYNRATYRRLRAKNGWSETEEQLLFGEVTAARREGRPLKSVFLRVADATGRKPNSIRNYYYLRIREDGSRAAVTGAAGAFIPFTADETAALVRAVLSAQARGCSVRACTLELGGGDTKAMLRYQNKYRAVIKSDPQLVRAVMEDMRYKGEPVFDPFTLPDRPRAGRPRKSADALFSTVRRTVDELSRVDGLAVGAFFESLGALAVGASKGGDAESEAKRRLRERNLELAEQLISRDRELAAQRERFGTLMSMFRQLIDVNKSFLAMRPELPAPAYMSELSQCVAAVDSMLSEYAR